MVGTIAVLLVSHVLGVLLRPLYEKIFPNLLG